jgi:cellulose synthase/poly-beta-1,6-N-acetylglucosamine synthase-like glycosyltransferase
VGELFRESLGFVILFRHTPSRFSDHDAGRRHGKPHESVKSLDKIDLDDAGTLVSVEAVDNVAEAKQKLSELGERVKTEAKQKFSVLGEKAKTDGLPMAKALGSIFLERVRWWRIAFFVLHLLVWSVLEFLDTRTNLFLSLNVLEFLSGGTNSKFHHYLAVISALLIFLPAVWRSPLARLGAVCPLVFMFIFWIRICLVAEKIVIGNMGPGFYIAFFLCAIGAVWAFLEYRSRSKNA